MRKFNPSNRKDVVDSDRMTSQYQPSDYYYHVTSNVYPNGQFIHPTHGYTPSSGSSDCFSPFDKNNGYKQFWTNNFGAINLPMCASPKNNQNVYKIENDSLKANHENEKTRVNMNRITDSKSHEKRYICPIPVCRKKYAYKNAFESHVMEHAKNRIEVSHRIVDNYSDEQYFENRNIETKVYSCTFVGCGKNFSSHNLLKSHLRIHICKPKDGKLSFACSICSNEFSDQDQLFCHMKQHMANSGAKKTFGATNLSRPACKTVNRFGSMQYVCEEAGCFLRFPSISLLNEHTKHSHVKTRCTSKMDALLSVIAESDRNY